ncbi:hypothetical protein N657DRAFT_374809 [Parathielavia appendiculata]|uniref:Uncharacterized protein n=1 Tax=Parathielavia appendiculata TaxID=2587402 RepID=A0AAN6TPM1_9PEZI|nr:hypothetical protein N657DRAFT_374809 [Parathielavia appendiculata]
MYWLYPFINVTARFATVCDLVELKKFSAVDLSPKIDGLAEGWQSSDIPFAMTIPISEFEDMFQAEIDPRGPPTAATTAAHSKDDDSASTPGDGASQTNDEQQHHSAQSPGFYHPGSMRAALSSYDSITVPVDSEPNAGNGEADSRCHGRESATSMCDAQGSQTAHVESAAVDGLRCSSPFNIGTNSPPATETASRGWEESRATIFQSINANGMTTSKDQEADELYQSTSGGVLAAREASSLYLLADAAGRGREERRYAEVAPISGPDRGGQSTSSRPNKDQKMGQVATVHSNLGATLSLAIPPSRLGTETQLPSASGSQPGQLHSPAGFSGSSPSETQSPSPLEQVLSERSQERVSHCGLWPNSLPDVIPCGNYISDEALLMSICK